MLQYLFTFIIALTSAVVSEGNLHLNDVKGETKIHWKEHHWEILV